jgi:hypothetical protein
MADRIRRVPYFVMHVSNRSGEGAKVLEVLRKNQIDLLAFSGFPQPGRRAQLDFVPANPAAFLKVARKAKWKVRAKKIGFLVQGKDRVGACAGFLGKLAAKKINVTAVEAVTAGAGRYGAIFWVKARDVQRAAKALRI